MNSMLAPLLALLMSSPAVSFTALAPVQTQEQRQAPIPHPEVQKLIDEATGGQVALKDMLPLLERALVKAMELKDLCGEGRALNWMGRVYDSTGDKRKAVEFFDRALQRLRESGDKAGEATTLNNIGAAWSVLGEPRKALQFYEDARPLLRQLGDLSREAGTLTNIGAVSFKLGENRRALDAYEQARHLFQKAGDVRGEARVLNNMGLVWTSLGDLKKAQGLHEVALPLRRKVGDLSGEAASLNNIGLISLQLHDYRKALSSLEQALPLVRSLGNIAGEAVTLSNMGSAWSGLGKTSEAIRCFEDALVLQRKVGDIAGEAYTQGNIGRLRADVGEASLAIAAFFHALPLLRRAGNVEGEATILENISLAWSSLRNSGLSISWAKLSANTTQAFRQSSSGISASADRSLLHSIRDRYTALSAALQSQGRIAEALQVQELQEASRIKEFVYRGTAEQDMFSKRLSLTKLEKHWMGEYERAAKPLDELGKQRGELARTKERLPEQEKALQAIEVQLKNAEANFRKTIDAMTEAFKETAPEDNQLVDLAQDRDLTLIAKTLSVKTGKKVGCFATVVGEKSTSVMFIGPDAKVVTKTVNISRTDLSRAVTAVLGDLNSPKRQPFETSKKLYDLVVKPFEGELKGLDCVMFNLNGPLRYVPMAALWDGKRYLAERFQVTNFSIAVWENLAKDPPKIWSAEFFGLTQKVEGFSQLPGVKAEVEDAAPLFKATPRLDGAFSKSSLESLLKQRTANLLHFGTHFVLDPASSEETFMVLGDGTKWRPTEMEQDKELTLEGVELLVAGACSTGVPTGDDASIEGFGAYCQVKGARSVLSTLWEVNDASTSSWMQSFYRLLASGKGKGEAFHRAQLAMITGEGAASLKLPKGGSRAGSATSTASSSGKPYVVDPKRPHSHPYYWAPFTLSGNWR